MSMPSARPVRALRGAQWLVNAYALFRCNPGIWIGVILMLLVTMVLSSAIPLIGPLAFGLLFPVFSAGLGQAARATDRGETLDMQQFLAGFRASTADLVAIGGFYVVGQLLVVSVMLALGGSAMSEGISSGKPPPQVSGPDAAGMLFAALAGLLLLLPLLAATWFAPLLVFFHQQKALPSLQASFHACLRNWRPFLIYCISMVLILVLARLLVSVLSAIPLIGPLFALALVGAIVAVLAPVGFIAFYTSYIDVFAEVMEEREAAPDHMLLP